MKLNSPWYELVCDGKKIYEGRRLLPYIEKYKIGDIIEISHYIDTTLPIYQVIIEDIQYYRTFEDAFQYLPITEILPLDGITIQQGIEIYKQYVSIPTQIKDGIVMIKIKRI